MSDSREKILNHACELFLESGLDGFSMRKLAREVGVTAPALYKHYDSRERLLQDVMVQAYERFAHYLYRAMAGNSPEERMQLAREGYLDFALEQPRLFDFLFSSLDGQGITEVSPEVEALGCAIGQFWHDRVRECIDAGILRPGDPEAISTTMWAHAHGLLNLHQRGILAREGPMGDAAFREIFVASGRRLLEGLGTEAYVRELRARESAGQDGAEDDSAEVASVVGGSDAP